MLSSQYPNDPDMEKYPDVGRQAQSKDGTVSGLVDFLVAHTDLLENLRDRIRGLTRRLSNEGTEKTASFPPTTIEPPHPEPLLPLLVKANNQMKNTNTLFADIQVLVDRLDRLLGS